MATPILFDGNKGGLLSKLFSIFGSSKKAERGLIMVIAALKDFKGKLEEMRRRLEDRHNELLSEAIKAWTQGNRDKASIFASEVIEVRKLIKNINVADLAIEKVIQRLRTIDIVRDTMSLMTVAEILKGLRARLSTVMPDMISALDTVISNVNSLVSSTRVPETGLSPSAVVVKNAEVEEVLKEVEKQAEQRTLKGLGPMPEVIVRLAQSEPRKPYMDSGRSREVEPLRVTTVPPVPAQPASFRAFGHGYVFSHKQMMLEDKVYEYVITHGGFIDVADCALRFGVRKEDVIEALKSLERKGLIKLS
ncbi:MAG: hypothetical protein DRO12_00355 [Thermoprotei archaeon]|nr:MAG: hypothetical protein DRO12_00355 [Thermoprotei archaeon]